FFSQARARDAPPNALAHSAMGALQGDCSAARRGGEKKKKTIKGPKEGKGNTRGGQWQGCLCLLGALASPRGARRQAAARTDFKDLPRRVPESDAPSAAAPGGRRAGEAGGTPWRAWRSAGGAPSALA
ncbi:unnamed protein product, partial [Prorocentrum cordatum]